MNNGTFKGEIPIVATSTPELATAKSGAMTSPRRRTQPRRPGAAFRLESAEIANCSEILAQFRNLISANRNWHIVPWSEEFVQVANPLFDKVYIPLGSLKKPEFPLYLKAQFPGEEFPRAVLGIQTTRHGLRLERVGHNGSFSGRKAFSDFLRLVNVVSTHHFQGIYTELHGAPLAALSDFEIDVVNFDLVRKIHAL